MLLYTQVRVKVEHRRNIAVWRILFRRLWLATHFSRYHFPFPSIRETLSALIFIKIRDLDYYVESLRLQRSLCGPCTCLFSFPHLLCLARLLGVKRRITGSGRSRISAINRRTLSLCPSLNRSVTLINRVSVYYRHSLHYSKKLTLER